MSAVTNIKKKEMLETTRRSLVNLMRNSVRSVREEVPWRGETESRQHGLWASCEEEYTELRMIALLPRVNSVGLNAEGEEVEKREMLKTKEKTD